MADLKLDVDIGSLLQADKAVRDFERRFSDLERAARRGATSQESLVRVFDRLESAGLSLSQVYSGMERDLANSARTAARLENEFRSLTLSGKSARDSARAMEQAFREQERAAEENARAVQEQARQYDMLRTKYDPLYAASQLYERSLNEIDLAHQKGAISAQRQAQLVDQLNLEYQQFAAGSSVASNRFVANQMAMTGAAQGSARGVNRLGVITQQSGYQIGDFLVQVQSGTNWMVAFGQQATQVAGTLTLLGGKWLLIGSALGIAIPLITAIGAAFLRTRGEAESFDKVVDRLEDSLSELSDNMGLVDDLELDVRFGNLTTEVRNLAMAMVELNAASELSNLTSVLDQIEGQVTAGFWSTLREGFRLPGFGEVNEDTPEVRDRASETLFSGMGLPMGRQSFLDQVGLMQSAAGAGDREGVVRIFEDMVAQIREAEGGMAAVSQEGRDLVAEIYRASLATAETNALLNGTAAEAARIREQQELNAEIYEELVELSRELQDNQLGVSSELYQRLSSLRQEEQLQRLIAQHGEDSAEVAELQAEQARRSYELEAMKAGIFGESLSALMDQYDATRDAADEAERLSGAFDLLSGFSDLPITQQVAILRAELGLAADEALRLVNNMPVGMTYGNTRALSGMSGEELIFGGQPGDIRRRGGDIQTVAEIISARRKQISQEIELLRLTGQQRSVRQIQLELEREYKGTLDGTGRAAIAAAAEQIAAQERVRDALRETRDRQQDVANALESSFTSGFMSIIDGTKSTSEAFKDMARSIIAQLFEILVVQRLVGSFNATTGVGTGLVGGIMRIFSGRESGGSMMANKPYLVGERGPELVIPGRSATVTNANLTEQALGGNGGAVNVYQTINVSTGVQQTVRNEIKQLMPQIAESAKSAVVDAKRRGGSYGRAFS